MFQKIAGFALFCVAAAWHWIWDGVKGKLFDQGSAMLSPYITPDQVVSWGPTVILPLIGAWLLFKTRAPSATPQECEATPTPDNTKRISDAIIVAGNPPEYRARFRQNGKNAIFYIEYSLYSQKGWTQPRKLKAFTADRFASGETISFPLVHRISTDRGDWWHIGIQNAAEIDSGVIRNILGEDRSVRGRVTLLTEDDQSEHCYFILWTGPNKDDPPHVRGEHMFSHMFEWEGKTPPNGNHRSLFK